MAEHVLKDGDSTKLFNLLKGAVHSWRRVADGLNFTYKDKTDITTTPGLNGNEDYFQALLDQWLKREHHLTTVEVLANALRSAGEHRLAYELERNPELMSPDRVISSKMATGKQQSSGDTHGVEGASATDRGSSTGANCSEPQQPSTSSVGVDETDSPATASGADSEVPPVLKKDQFPSLYDIELTEIDDSQSEEILKSVDILLMVVNENEYSAVLGLMKPVESEEKIIEFTQKGVTFLIGKYGKYRTAVVQTSPGGQGPDGAEQKTIRAIEVLKPSVVISVGVAYGKSKETQRLGDVLVCNLVHDYSHKRLGENETRIRNPQPPVGGSLLNIFKTFVGWRKERGNGEICRVKVGPLVSDSNLIDNLQDKDKIFKTFPDAIGGEMEGAAIMSAIHGIQGTHKPEGIVIKAICDWGDGTKNKKWQPFAAHSAADYVLHHMKKKGFASLVG